MSLAADSGRREGDDFLHLFLQKTAEYSPWIRAQKVDLLNYSWDGGPIEILIGGELERQGAIQRGARKMMYGSTGAVLQFRPMLGS
jgi:hypothetical protein